MRTMLTMQAAVLLRPQLASRQLNTRKLPIDIQFCVKMPSMSDYNGVDWMKVNRTYSIDVDLVQALRSKRNQSNTVCRALRLYLAGEDEFSIADVPLFQLMAAVAARTDDESLKVLLYGKIKDAQTKKNPSSLNEIKWKGPPSVNR